MKAHAHKWIPIRRGYPQEICRCGALSVLDLKVGKRTIYVTPGGVEVVRWTASQDPLQAGDLGMDLVSGRGKLFVGSPKKILVEGDLGIGITRVVSSVAGNTVLDAARDFVVVTATATITFPTAVGISGKVYTVKSNADSIVVTFNTTGGQTIDGAASGVVTLAQRYQFLNVVSDNVNWLVW